MSVEYNDTEVVELRNTLETLQESGFPDTRMCPFEHEIVDGVVVWIDAPMGCATFDVDILFTEEPPLRTREAPRHLEDVSSDMEDVAMTVDQYLRDAGFSVSNHPFELHKIANDTRPNYYKSVDNPHVEIEEYAPA